MATESVRRPARGRPAASRATMRRRASGRPRPPTYLLLVGLVAVLNLIGLVMVLSASSVQALRNHGSSFYFFDRQILWVLLGTVAIAVTASVDYRVWRRAGVPLLVLSVVLMAIVLVPGVGIRVGGSSRWLGAGPFRMQPSELAKFALLLFSADLLARRADAMNEARLTKRPVLLAFGLVAALLLLQPDLGTTLVTGLIVVTVLFVAGLPVRSMLGLVGLAAAGTAVLAKAEPYRWQRMTSFLDPFADASNTGYQAAQARLALASGGLAGTGLGASKAKWGFLPAAHTDFIFAIVGEELGLIGTLAIVALFAGLAALGVRAALRAPDRFGTLMASGVTAWIVGQAIINIGAVVGLLPITGVPLPFVSAGGSSLGITMAAAGVLLNITRQARPVRTTAGAKASATR